MWAGLRVAQKGGVPRLPWNVLKSVLCVRSCWDTQGQDSPREVIPPQVSLTLSAYVRESLL